MTKQTPNILILGGGYAGIMAALRLAHRARALTPTITLINASEHFVERCRLHEQATGTELPARPLRQMLRGRNIRFLQGSVTALDPVRQTVLVKSATGEQQLAYDYVINALGSRVNVTTVAGVAEHAFVLDLDGVRATTALQQKLATLAGKAFRAIIVGGGATGIEVATQIKAIYPQSRVEIVTQGRFGAFRGDNVQRHLVAALKEQQIAIHENARVTQVDADGVVLDSGKVAADVVIWAGGFVASPLACEAGVQTNAQNQMLVDPYLRSISHPNLFAVGDLCAPIEEPGAPTRMSLMVALVSGAQAAENVAATLKGETLQPLSFLWFGQGIALGPNDAVSFTTYPVDQPWRLILRRKLALGVRNFFVWYLVAALELERRFPGSFYWSGKGRYQQQKEQQKRQQAQHQVTAQG